MNLTFPVTGDNYGGVDRFWFIHEDDISHVDQYGQIIPKTGKYWNLGKGTKYTVTFRNPADDRKGGTVYNPRLSGTVKKYRPDLEQLLESMRSERYALIYKDLNGYLIQVGRPHELLTFTTDQETGGLPSENNSYGFTFTGRTMQRPVFYFGRIPVAPGTPEEPVIGSPVKVFRNGALAATVPPGGAFYITSDFNMDFLFERTITAPEYSPPVGAPDVVILFNGQPIQQVPPGSSYSINSDFIFLTTYTDNYVQP